MAGIHSTTSLLRVETPKYLFLIKISEVYAVDLYSVVPTISGVDSSIIGEKARNLVGQYVKFSPISGNSIEFHYKIKTRDAAAIIGCRAPRRFTLRRKASW